MGKIQPDEDFAKVLFSKKSFSSYSKTLSTLSNHTRNTVKRKVSANKGFYADKGKIKRDLSIETDLCAIRRRFKEQLKQILNSDANSLINQRSQKSAKSRYSDFTEAAEEFERDESASGDNTYDKSDANRRGRGPFPISKEYLLYKNFNKLVETWIEQILKDNEVQTKIQKVLLKTLGPKHVALPNKKTSSGTTYILETDEYNDVNRSKSFGKNSSATQYFNDDHSVSMVPTAQTVPLIYETIRLISTLSLPRYINRKKNKFNRRKHKSGTKRYKIKKEPHNYWFVNLQMEGNDKSRTSIDLLEYPTTALLQSIASWDQKSLACTKFQKSPELSLFGQRRRPVPINTKPKQAKESSGSENFTSNFAKKEKKKLIQSVYNEGLKQWIQPKLYKSGPRSKNYNEFGIIGKQEEATLIKCNETGMISCRATLLREADQSDHMVTVDYLANKLTYREKYPMSVSVKCGNDTGIQDITGTEPNVDQNKIHTPSIKVCRRRYRKNILTRRIEDIIGHSMKGEKVPKLDIHVNIFPNNELSAGTSQVEIDKNTSQYNGACIAVVPGYTYAEGDVEKEKNCSIMPLLDGAESKYFINADSLSKTERPLNTTISKDQASMTTDLGLREEFNEIKERLKIITHLVSKVGQIDSYKYASPNSSKSIQVETKPFRYVSKKKSQGMQVLKGLSSGIKQKKTSGFTFKKHGKINTIKNNRLMNVDNSTASYKVIDSESIIHVTDMDKDVSEKTLHSVALTCSMQQHNSLYEVSSVMKAAGDMTKSKIMPFSMSTNQSKYRPLSPIIHLTTQPNIYNTEKKTSILKTGNELNTFKASYPSTQSVQTDDHYSVKKENDREKMTTKQDPIKEKFCLTLNQATQSQECSMNHSDSPAIKPTIHKTVKKAQKRRKHNRNIKYMSSTGAEKPTNDTVSKMVNQKESESTELMVHNLSQEVGYSSYEKKPPSSRKLLQAHKIFTGRTEKVSGKWSTYGDSIGKNKIPNKHSAIATRKFLISDDSHCVDIETLSSGSSMFVKEKEEVNIQLLVRFFGSIVLIAVVIAVALYYYNNTSTDPNEKMNITTNLFQLSEFNLTELGF